MPEFLELRPPFEALNILLKNLPGWKARIEKILSLEANGRVTAEAVYSPESLPAFNRSTVDGFAVIARDTYGASEAMPTYLNVIGEVPMGRNVLFNLKTGDAAAIHTGGMLPKNSDAVVMLEYTQNVPGTQVEVLRAAAPGENVLFTGEDVNKGDEVIPHGKRLGPADVGGLAAVGVHHLMVAVPPNVGIISSGDEIIAPSENPDPGQVRDINTYSLSSLITDFGGSAIPYGIVPDQSEHLVAALMRALKECDLVVITAGSSASARDLTASVINMVGKPGVIIHGVNVRPGKPSILAVCDGKPVVGLPGNPVSALVIGNIFLKPLIDYFYGIPPKSWQPAILASLSTNISSQAGREDWIPVQLKNTTRGITAVPIFFKSNFIFNLSRADGFIRIAPDENGLDPGTMVLVFPIS